MRSYVRDEANAGAVQSKVAISFNSSFRLYRLPAFPGASLLVRNTNKGENVPSQFGYEMHKNIIANEPTLEPELRYSILSKYNTNGPEKEFPYNNEDEIFNVDEIIEALNAAK